MDDVSTTNESDLLLTLWEIREWVHRASEPVRNLTNVACLIGNRFYCDVCSIYVVAPDRKTIVLAATVGLRQDCVGKLQLEIGEGLCGQVAATQKPVMVERAAMTHPQFKYFPEAGEEPYESFLGVPIGFGSDLRGILVVQTTQPRSYSNSEIQMLTLAGDLLVPAVRLSNGWPVEETALGSPSVG